MSFRKALALLKNIYHKFGQHWHQKCPSIHQCWDVLASGTWGWSPVYSSIASPICQEGQSEKTFPIFPLFLNFFPLFSNFSWFSPSFSWFLAIFFCCQGGTLPPLTPSGYATDCIPIQWKKYKNKEKERERKERTEICLPWLLSSWALCRDHLL